MRHRTVLVFLAALLFVAWTATVFAVGPGATVNSVPIVAGAPVATANPLPVKLGDGTNSPTVKAASTAATATDKALVVAVHPSTPVLLSTALGDPCQNPHVAKSSAVINVGAATTGSLVAASSGKAIYVCGYTASLGGTTPTVKFVQGTTSSTACDTGPADLSGAMAPTSGSIWSAGFGGTLIQTSAGNALCATTTGASSSFQGRITYVQQ